MIRVLLVDDQELIRTGLRAVLGSEGDIDVVGEAADGSVGVSMSRALAPDVVLMDLRMPRMNGIEATQRIVADPALAETRVLVLTTFDTDEDILSAIRAGASGYLLKDLEPTSLRKAVRTVAAGDALLDPSVTATVLAQLAATSSSDTQPGLLNRLTERETEVLQHVGLGENNAEIASALYLSAATARTYVSRLLAKTGCRDRAQLVVLAYEAGLVTPGADSRARD
ncbi:MAG: response regulator [Galactobacter sp.]